MPVPELKGQDRLRVPLMPTQWQEETEEVEREGVVCKGVRRAREEGELDLGCIVF